MSTAPRLRVVAKDHHEPNHDAQITSVNEQTEQANAERLVKRFGPDIRYCFQMGRWFCWKDGRWAEDKTGAVQQMAKQIAKEVSAAAIDSGELSAIRFAQQSSGRRGIESMISLARSDVPVLPGEFDRDPTLFNCRNGTLDLSTGRLRAARRDDLITQQSPVNFDPEAQCPTWHEFLNRIFGGRESLIGYMQRLAGYFLTGLVTEQLLPIFYGVGANGKTTFLTTITEIMGEHYAMPASRDLLTVKRWDSHPAELAALFGKRLVVASETDDGSRLAESLVKQLTGGDKITARRMREDFWSFDPTHKLVLATNHKPEVNGTDLAVWRRLHLVPFDVVIPDSEQDKNLPAKLKAEAPGILRWMVEGCTAWHQHGLGMPDEIKKATATYRSEQDVLSAFIADECVIGNQQYRVRAGQLFDAYKTWCQRSGEHARNQKRFGQGITERGFRKMSNDGTWYLGVGLRDGGTSGTASN
jgi:putative DNA primase/helicase